MAAIPKKPLKTMDGKSLAYNLMISIIFQDGKLTILDKKGVQRSYSVIEDKDGKRQPDVDDFIKHLAVYKDKTVGPLLRLPNGDYIRVLYIEAIEPHQGRDFKGVIMRGADDAILNYLEVTNNTVREVIVDAIDTAIETAIAGKFMQPNWNALLTTTETK